MNLRNISPAQAGILACQPQIVLPAHDAVEAPQAILPIDPLLLLAIKEHLGVDASVPLSAEALLTPLWSSSDAVHQLFLMNRHTSERHCPAVASVAEAVTLGGQYAAEGFDVYHACAEFLLPNNRTANNAKGACALWLDLDCGSDKVSAGKGYLTKVDAFLGVMAFCQKTQLPNPTHIVDSGGGLHVYWVFDRTIPADQWRESARKFKYLTQTLDLKADATRTADIASVLRLPGTFNFKTDPPRPVALLYATSESIRSR
jgi:hypothetical protein